MEYTRLGRTGLQVSRLCLGTMNFGNQAPEADGRAIMDRALEAGLHFFDTANGYGGKAGKGATEEILGRWLSQGGRRDRIVLATKCYGRMGDGPNDRGLSAYNIRQSCEASLERLQTDRIDLYQMHHVDRSTPWDEIWEAMDRLVRQGKVLYVGSSNFAGWHVATAQAEAARRGLLGLVSEQSLYNLHKRAVELELLPACRALGIGVIPYSPLSGGLLGGVPETADGGRRASENAKKRLPALKPQLERYEALCRDLGHPPAAVALAWLLGRPGVTAPIIGPRTVAQLEGALAALEVRLDEAAAKRLDEIFPGPGGEAPEAYAW